MRRSIHKEALLMVRRLSVLVSFALIFLIAATTWAIPTNPDPIHTAAATPWPNPLPVGFNPATDRHQHWSADPIDGVAGQFATYAVWDDNTYRYSANTPTQGHGYMQNPATYAYTVNVPPQADPLFNNNVVNYWEATINGPGLNSNNFKVNTKINFGFPAPNANPDIIINFDNKYPVIKPNPNPMLPPITTTQDFPSPGEIDPNGTWGGNPGNPGGGPGGGSEGVLAFWTPGLQRLTFNSNVDWYYLNPALGPNGGQFDFVTTALHEFGHILGLDHAGVAGDVMFGSSSSYVVNNMNIVVPLDPSTEVRTLDAGAILGSKILYTIAVPEPSTIFLAMTAACAVVFWTRRKTY
jgi:Matrixin/PEP-CTERM motif